jgi:hypothetical protein
VLVLDVFAVAVASYSIFFVGLLLGANGVFLLLRMMGEKEILRLIFELVLHVVVVFVRGLENGMGATHFGRFMLVGSSAFVVCRGMSALKTFLVGEDEVT